MDKKIMTVCGPIGPQDLGFTQSHEHILLRKGQSFLVNEVLWQDEPEKSLDDLNAYYDAGGRAIVDAQPVGCGRMAADMRKISFGSDVHIIASTGFHKLCFYPEDHWIRTSSEEDLTQLYVKELTEGMFEDGDDAWPNLVTKALAGQIKTALDTEGLTPRYETLFKAAAAAQVKTGAPLMVHVASGSDPRELLAMLQAGGVKAESMIFCHMDRMCPDTTWHKEIASAGCFLEYDTIGRYKYHSDERECELIREMISEGFADRLLVSLDTTRARLGAYGGQIDLCYIIDQFVPLLLSSGVSVDDIRKMTTENPARAFAY